MPKRGGVYIVINPEVQRELIKLGFNRESVREWLSEKTGVLTKDIHIAVAGGVPGYTVLWVLLDTNAHVIKKIHGATLTKAGRNRRPVLQLRRK